MATEFEILDVHHHVGNAFRALGGAVDSAPELGEAEFEKIELASRLEIMDRSSVQQALVIPGHGYHRTNGIADTRAENDAIARYRDRTPDRFPGAIGIVEPRDGPASLAEIDRCKNERHCCIERDRLVGGEAVRSEGTDSHVVTGTFEVLGQEDLSPSDAPARTVSLNATVPSDQPTPGSVHRRVP